MKEEILKSLRQEHALKNFIGTHPRFTNLMQKLKNIACKNVSVLLIGETGTGKGRCAEYIHQYGDRFNDPFIPFNCGAAPESLFESQIFGHIKGAFTGAYQDRLGLVEEADTGILFLDEVNSLAVSTQVKLNYFLETGLFRRVGENRFRKADVQIISASNVDLPKEVNEGNFREDLYYRLAEYEVRVPPLRVRKEDIALLVAFFINKNDHLNSNGHIKFSAEAMLELSKYHWPGNIRELENFIKRCLIDAGDSVINSISLPPSIKNCSEIQYTSDLESLPWRRAKMQIISTFERKYLKSLLQKYQGIVAQCARHAGIQSSDFWKLMRKYRLKAHSFRSIDS